MEEHRCWGAGERDKSWEKSFCCLGNKQTVTSMEREDGEGSVRLLLSYTLEEVRKDKRTTGGSEESEEIKVKERSTS